VGLVKRWIARRLIVACKALNVVLISWAGRQLLADNPAPTPEFHEYVPGDGRITPLVINAAWHDSEGSRDRQSTLNACMESLRQCETIMGASKAMLGELSVRYGVEEAFVRVIANHVLLGIHLGRRLAQ